MERPHSARVAKGHPPPCPTHRSAIASRCRRNLTASGENSCERRKNALPAHNSHTRRLNTSQDEVQLRQFERMMYYEELANPMCRF